MEKYPNIKISWTKLYRATLHTHRNTHASLGGTPGNAVEWGWKCFRAGGPQKEAGKAVWGCLHCSGSPYGSAQMIKILLPNDLNFTLPLCIAHIKKWMN